MDNIFLELRVFLPIFLFVILVQVAIGQDSVTMTAPYRRKSAWIELGAGRGGQGVAYNVSAQIQLTEGMLMSLVYDGTNHESIDLHFNVFAVPSNGIDTQTFGLLVGKLSRYDWGLITYSSGLTVVKVSEFQYTSLQGACGWFCLAPQYQTKIDRTTTLGIPLDLKLILAGRTFGFVFNPFLNLNLVNSYGGLKLNLALGRINRKGKFQKLSNH